MIRIFCKLMLIFKGSNNKTTFFYLKSIFQEHEHIKTHTHKASLGPIPLKSYALISVSSISSSISKKRFFWLSV